MSRITMATRASSSTRSTRLPDSACDWITIGVLPLLQLDAGWRSNGPLLSAMGSDSVQLRPSGRHSNRASPPSWLVTEAVMILVPNPCAVGARVAGPPDSIQLSRSEPASSSQLSLTLPAGDDSAPYL